MVGSKGWKPVKHNNTRRKKDLFSILIIIVIFSSLFFPLIFFSFIFHHISFSSHLPILFSLGLVPAPLPFFSPHRFWSASFLKFLSHHKVLCTPNLISLLFFSSSSHQKRDWLSSSLRIIKRNPFITWTNHDDDDIRSESEYWSKSDMIIIINIMIIRNIPQNVIEEYYLFCA